MVELDGIEVVLGGQPIVRGVTTRFAPGALSVLLGPNGAGKSTLLRVAAGLRRPTRGTVRIGGRDLAEQTPAALARVRAVLGQHAEPAFPLRVRDVVEMGRYPHYDRVPSRHDHEAVAQALETVGMTAFRDRAFATLSAGEQQKVQMARVLAQVEGDGMASRVLFLDEPTSNLDVHHQLHLLTIARGLLGRGVTVIAVLHDLDLAADFADHLLLLADGRLVHHAPAAEGIPVELVEQVYRVRARRLADPVDGGGAWRFRLP